MTRPETEPALPQEDCLAPMHVREIALGRPLRWLALGWRDFSRALVPSGLHGILIAVGGLAIVTVAWRRPYLLAGALSGFLLVGPVIATGLYEMSRRLAAGQAPTFRHVLDAWRASCRCVLGFGLMLVVVGTFWVLISALLIALFADDGITDIGTFLRQVLLAPDSHLLEVWMALGGLLAALVFSASVVSIPMMLDRDVDLLTAVLTSIYAVAANPVPLAFWAGIIMALTVLSMATLFLGLIVVVPVLGHATWHAYVELVDASPLRARQPDPSRA